MWYLKRKQHSLKNVLMCMTKTIYDVSICVCVIIHVYVYVHVPETFGARPSYTIYINIIYNIQYTIYIYIYIHIHIHIRKI